ncbi:hypothetical protein EN745_22445 [Mesorhizobium sp. M4A.F.Ca.ET.022.05.2.1]|nr:hypothetical protein EN745_22445 [Mesorhizobium sp. M4A.F.Ca.ET.022.05.2.1]
MDAASKTVVILGRGKERSDAAQTLGSMPRRRSGAEFCQAAITDQGNGMDSRVFAMPLRGCFALE